MGMYLYANQEALKTLKQKQSDSNKEREVDD